MLRELAEKAKKIDVEKLALEVAKANQGLITDNVIDQLDIGIAGDGLQVGKYSTNYYSRLKKRMGSNAPFGIVDLKFSTDLYKGLRTKVSKTEFLTTVVGVPYSKYQIDRYGKRIFENTSENLEIVKNKNSVDIVKEYSKQLGL